MNAEHIKINAVALDAAIEAGADAATAGEDDQAQLVAAIKAYLVVAIEQGDVPSRD